MAVEFVVLSFVEGWEDKIVSQKIRTLQWLQKIVGVCLRSCGRRDMADTHTQTSGCICGGCLLGCVRLGEEMRGCALDFCGKTPGVFWDIGHMILGSDGSHLAAGERHDDGVLPHQRGDGWGGGGLGGFDNGPGICTEWGVELFGRKWIWFFSIYFLNEKRSRKIELRML